jgi:hypothetical protein
VNAKSQKEVIVAFGHQNMLAIHPTTLMITKDTDLSKQGDCIVAVGADKAVVDLSPEFKDGLRNPRAKLTILIEVDGTVEQIHAEGSPKLTLTHTADIVVRKSDFTSDRTLAIHADKASNDLPRELIKKLANPKQKIKITLILNEH